MKNEFETTEPNVTEENNTTATSHSNTLTIGMVLDGKYEIRREIARGGMGIVYEAYHNFFKKRVAIKIILSDKINSLQLKRFQKEIEACAKLSHPNIIHIYNAGIYNNIPYIVMDYIDGVDICQYVEQHDENYGKIKLHNAGLGIKRDWKLCVKLIYETALALEYIHSKKMLHRDIKPSNILVQPDGTPIIIDLGLVKFQSEKFASLTKTGELLGTLQYMSIEQAQGKHREIDARSDIYSLGLVLYELLTERMAYSGKNVMETFYNIISYYPPLPREINPKIPEALEEITIHATEKKKEKRYATAQEFADALKKYLDNGNTQATKKYNYYKKRVQLQQNKNNIVACCIAVVVIIIATIAIIITSKSNLNNTQIQEAIGKKRENGVTQNYKKAYSPKAEELYQQGREEEKAKNYSKSINSYQKASQQGHAEASWALYEIYRNSLVVNQDLEKARYYYNKAIEQGHESSQSNSRDKKSNVTTHVIYNDSMSEDTYLALLYKLATTNYMKQDYKKASEYYEILAKKGNSKGQWMLAHLYYRGLGVEQDYKKAFDLFQQAINQGNIEVHYDLGWMYHHGLGVEQDYKKAFEYYEKCNHQDNPIVQYHLGYMCYYGLGIEQDYKKAFDLFQQATNQGNIEAQYYLGIMYYNGQGVEKDSSKAISYFKRIYEKKLTNASYLLNLIGKLEKQNIKKLSILLERNAKKGNKSAQFDLGIIYFYGLGINADLKKAKNYFEQATKQNHKGAQFNLGYMYHEGLGVDTDFKKAVELFEIVANNKCIEAQALLGEMYACGEGVKQDHIKKVYWYEKAANQGHADSQYQLGEIYECGIGVKQDYTKAVYWYEKAANQGHAKAKKRLNK